MCKVVMKKKYETPEIYNLICENQHFEMHYMQYKFLS